MPRRFDNFRRRTGRGVCPVCSPVARKCGVSPTVKLYLKQGHPRGKYELCGDEGCEARIAVEYLRQEQRGDDRRAEINALLDAELPY